MTNTETMSPGDWIKLAGEILAFIGIVFAVIKYAQEKKREFQKRLFEEQLKTYTEAVDAASVISLYNKNKEEYKTAVMDFNRLYGGVMCLIEDRDVETRMMHFNAVLTLYQKLSDAKTLEIVNRELKYFAMVLAHTCRNSSITTWDVNYKLERFNDFTGNIKEDEERIVQLQRTIGNN